MDSPIKAVLFDLDDTLFDHHHSLQASLLEMQKTYQSLQQRSLEDLMSTYVELLESTHAQILRGMLSKEEARIRRIREFFLKHGQSLSTVEIDAAIRLHRDAYQAIRRPVPGAVALLEYLRGSGIQIGIITNNTSREQHEKLTVCGLDAWVDVLVISEEVGVIKPDPAIFEIALERLGCGPGQTVMVGDSWEIDIMGARKAGIAPVWFNRFGSPCPDQTLATMIDTLEPAQTVAALLVAR